MIVRLSFHMIVALMHFVFSVIFMPVAYCSSSVFHYETFYRINVNDSSGLVVICDFCAVFAAYYRRKSSVIYQCYKTKEAQDTKKSKRDFRSVERCIIRRYRSYKLNRRKRRTTTHRSCNQILNKKKIISIK